MKIKKIQNYINIKNIKKISFQNLIYIFILIINVYLICRRVNNGEFHNNIHFYKAYIKKCKNLKILNNNNKKINKNPLISICLPVYNMEKYIEKAIISIINQFFEDFEIVIINDNSKDKSEEIIKKMQLNINKIRIINHSINVGIYDSRVDLILNSKGKYIIFLDPDDLFLNPYLFQQLFEFNKIKNLDIIEFIVYHENEEKNNLYYPSSHRENHYHKYKNKLIFQPELSNILFHEPQNKNYSDVICRCIWNKMIRKQLLYKTINLIGKFSNNNKHFNFAEDTIINIINFQYAFNYSNINLGGYMYNIRDDSASHKEYNHRINNNAFLYLKLFYKYIKYFKKDINYLLYDLKSLITYLFQIKDFNLTYFVNKNKLLFNSIKNEKNLSNNYIIYIKNLLMTF